MRPVTNYLIVSSETDSVVSSGRDLTAAVVDAIDNGWTDGRIYNQDGGSADLTEWVRDHSQRIEDYRANQEMTK